MGTASFPSAGPGPLGLQAAGQLGGPCFRARQAPPRPGGPLGPSSPAAPHPPTSVEAPHPHPGPGGWPRPPEASDPRLAAARSWGCPPMCPPLPSPAAASSSTTGAVWAWPSRVWCLHVPVRGPARPCSVPCLCVSKAWRPNCVPLPWTCVCGGRVGPAAQGLCSRPRGGWARGWGGQLCPGVQSWGSAAPMA